ADILGDRPVAVARELTKRHEEIRRGCLANLAARYREEGAPRGEIAIVIGPPEPVKVSEIDLDRLLRERLARQSLRDAVTELSEETGLARQIIYRRALALQNDEAEP